MFTSLEVKGDRVVSRTAVSTNEAFHFRYFSGRAVGDPGLFRRCDKLRRLVRGSFPKNSQEVITILDELRHGEGRRATTHETNSTETGCVGSGFGGCNYRARLGCISFRIDGTFSFTTSRRGRRPVFQNFGTIGRRIPRLEKLWGFQYKIPVIRHKGREKIRSYFIRSINFIMYDTKKM